MLKKLLIVSDDFGLTSGINYGILHAYLRHSISGADLIVNAPQTLEAVDLIQKYQMHCIGIHINITLGKPVSNVQDVPSLVNQQGLFHSSKWWLKNPQVNVVELILEFDNQIALFEKLIGKKPVHISYHHRYDFYKHYPSLAKHLFKKYSIPMRLERDEKGYPYEYAYNSSYFINQSILQEELLCDVVELPCHVGFVDKDIMKISSLNLQRMEDSYTVNSQEFKTEYQNLGYHLVGWEKIMKK